jgi:hypothetical protein
MERWIVRMVTSSALKPVLIQKQDLEELMSYSYEGKQPPMVYVQCGGQYSSWT